MLSVARPLEPTPNLGDSPNGEAPDGHDERSKHRHFLSVLVPVAHNWRGGPRGIHENKNAPPDENRNDYTYKTPSLDQPARTQHEKQPCDWAEDVARGHMLNSMEAWKRSFFKAVWWRRGNRGRPARIRCLSCSGVAKSFPKGEQTKTKLRWSKLDLPPWGRAPRKGMLNR